MPKTPKELKDILPSQRPRTKKRRKIITESQREIFKKEFLEEYKKDGAILTKTAEKVGFSRQVIYKWTETDPEFAMEFEKLRSIKRGEDERAWEKRHGKDEEYKKKFLELYADENHSAASALKAVSKKLNNEYFKYWMKTDFEFKKEYKRLQQLIRPRITSKSELMHTINSEKMRQKQNKFLEIFTAQHFNITNACKGIGITRMTLKSWCNNDPDFKAALDVAQDEKEDWVEDKLFKLIEDGNMVATIFATKILLQQKNLGRRHAYVEQPQKIEGYVEHKHSFDQDQLDALVRGRLTDRQKYEDLLQLDDPNIIDTEYTEE